MAATDLASFYLLLLSQNRGIFKTSFKSKCSSLEVDSEQISKYFMYLCHNKLPSNHRTYSIIDRFVFLSPIKILIKNMIPCIIFFFLSLHSYKEFIYLCVVATVSERKKMEIDFKMSKNRFVISLQNLGWDKKIDP